MKAKVIRYNNDTGKTIKKSEEDVIVSLGEYPRKIPEVSIGVPYGNSESESLVICLDIKELQEEISLYNGLKWLKEKKAVKTNW